MGLMTINTAVAADSSRPRLVVGIVVDQLRTDYLDYLQQLFGETGFKRLMKDGLFLKDVDFKANLDDPVAATALLYTGNYPNATGIPAAEIYRTADAAPTPVLEDKNSLGNFTHESLSPLALRLSTISDEVAIDGGGLTSVYAVSPDAQQAIIMAGHAGNCALWINDTDGKWSSTAYYRDFPQFITRRNRDLPLTARLDTLSWRPLLNVDRYPGIPAQKRHYPFRYTFPLAERDIFTRFKESAPVNEEVTDVAIDALRNLNLGRREEGIDMLSIGYTAAPYKRVDDGDFRFELEDTYLRLDAQLGRLLQAIDKEVGLSNTLLFLSSTGYYDAATKDDPKYRIPTGDVSLKRVESLLNSYLSAKYGNADYVSGIYGNQIYLDHRALESHGLTADKARAEARDFLVQMSGIADARTLGEILSDSSEESSRQRRSIDPKTAGDIFVTFLPGWNVVDETRYPARTVPVRAGTVSTPFFLMGPEVTARTVPTPVDAAAIAPTVTSALHIRSPNGASYRPLNY